MPYSDQDVLRIHEELSFISFVLPGLAEHERTSRSLDTLLLLRKILTDPDSPYNLALMDPERHRGLVLLLQKHAIIRLVEHTESNLRSITSTPQLATFQDLEDQHLRTKKTLERYNSQREVIEQGIVQAQPNRECALGIVAGERVWNHIVQEICGDRERPLDVSFCLAADVIDTEIFSNIERQALLNATPVQAS